MTLFRLLRFSVLGLGAFAFQGCTHVQSLDAFAFTVRVIDLADGKPVSGAEVFPILSSGVPDRPSINLGPLKTDAQGVARVRFPGQTVKVSSFDSYFVGGYDTWPWVHVTHPDYEHSGYSLPDDTQRKATETGEVLFRLKRKREPNPGPEPTAGK